MSEKKRLKPWLNKQWCIPKVGADFVWRMEDILELYQQPYDAQVPVVCFDERPIQLISETRSPIPAQPGSPQRYDYEYKREGTCNLFGFFQPKTRWRHLKVTQHRRASRLCFMYAISGRCFVSLF